MEKQTPEQVVKDWREELLGYLREMGRFKNVDDPLGILRQLSSFSARATYMNNLSSRSNNRLLAEFRSSEVQPFLRETDFQFRVWSRIGALVKDEWDMTRG